MKAMAAEKESMATQLHTISLKLKETESQLMKEKAEGQKKIDVVKQQTEDKLDQLGDELRISFKKHSTDETEISRLNQELQIAHEHTSQCKRDLHVISQSLIKRSAWQVSVGRVGKLTKQLEAMTKDISRKTEQLTMKHENSHNMEAQLAAAHAENQEMKTSITSLQQEKV